MKTRGASAMSANPKLTASKSNGIKALQILLFSLPVIYIGIILSVFVHEVFGHGLTALLLGGQFKSFSILLDGMGYAKIDVSNLSEPEIILMLLSGAGFTSFIFLLFLIFSMVLRKKTFLSIAFLYFAFACLLDGVPYFFWDAIFLGGVGDYSLIWALYPNFAVRIAVILLCGSLLLFGIAFFNFLSLKYWSGWMAEVNRLTTRWKIVLCLILFSLQAVGWLSFDWNQLIPGIGALPSAAAIGFTLFFLIILSSVYKFSENQPPQEKVSHSKKAISLAWAFCIALAITIIVWFQNGVTI
jgi:L-asparagine transporter-like permease